MANHARRWIPGAALCLATATAALDDYYPRRSPENFRTHASPQDSAAAQDSIRSSPAIRAPGDSLEYGRLPPIPGRSGQLPRILLREDLLDAAESSGRSLPRDAARIHRVETDSGAIISATAPVRVGKNGVRILRLMPDRSIRIDTLPIGRIRSIDRTLQPVSGPAEWMAFAGLLILPIAFAGGNPIPLLAGFGAGIGATSGLPIWSTRSAEEFLDRPGRWTGTLSVTQGIATRAAFNPDDGRAEFVPAFHFQADAGPRWSPFSFGMALRAISMDSPLNREGPRDTGWYEEYPSRADSAYAERSLAFALGPSVALVWSETPGYTLRSRVGGYLTFPAYPSRYSIDGTSAAVGAEFGLELDLRPVPHWAIRLEAAMLAPTSSEHDITLDPALAVGLAYAFHPRPAPNSAPSVLASVSAALSSRRFVPAFQLEQDLNVFNSVGVGTSYSRSKNDLFAPFGAGYWNREINEASVTSLFFTYGLHTDRSHWFHLGAQMLGGLKVSRASRYYESLGPDSEGVPTLYRSDSHESSGELALGIIPEIAGRLGAGFGVRLRLHLFNLDPFASDDNLRASVGLTYALPGRGAGR